MTDPQVPDWLRDSFALDAAYQNSGVDGEIARLAAESAAEVERARCEYAGTGDDG